MGERPVVGHGHEHAVEGVHQTHPAREQQGQNENRIPGQSRDSAGTGECEQSHLRRGIEAESEQHTHGIHLEWMPDAAHHRPEESCEKAPAVECLVELLLVETTAAQ